MEKADILKLKNQIEHEANIVFGLKFLELTGLKVGDEVSAFFSFSYGDRKSSYSTGGIRKGIIKTHKNGTLYIESVDKLRQSHSESNNRTGRNRKDWWVYEDKHTVTDLININF